MRSSILVTLVTLLVTLVQSISNDELLKLSKQNSNRIIELNDINHKQLLGSNRDSFLVVLLTATAPEVKCHVCIDFDPSFETIATSWFKDHPNGQSNSGEKSSMFFLRADVKETKNIPKVFKYYKIEHVPRVFLFYPGGDIDTYSIIELGNDAGIERVKKALARVQQLTSITDIKYYEPFDMTSSALSAFTVFCVVFLIKKYRSFVKKLFFQRFIWGIATVSFIILMLGGHMFNNIKKVRYAGVDNDGAILYFLPGQLQSQFSIETQIIAVIYGILAISVTSLTIGIPAAKKFLKNEKNSKPLIAVLPILLALLTYIAFSGLVSVYKIKQPSYPFGLVKLSSFFS
ncbi:hypothetical protein Kpol_1002p115 [Vanderwaltozyma polyspora DSM 70294]|uniref:Dolichyl-diphosphooligosaccharide--protein glycosyltransferase subunit 3 n=1 Tax=Vanderwaltozyma polyspora (strain ATCC 22028 / DSM 70294 / BCRC 21397 / CBS 2163 / NBRC 10782 / NRRL Y-8283 / UCD 57-17) TaxID=436907 RepID=A7TEE3_VANPO|nr:uncharacterized protein Kpol_1002p115 [Vanderwaltozyma polyspora DSM 70294]EDO19465.1 hypothetical protein Kpol_1002p115 [Vanderwaltozyma polyspora DSM 70294]